MVMEVIMEEKTSLHTLASGMKKYPQLLKNVKVSDKDTILNNKKVQECKEEIEQELKGNGRMLLRASGTEPVIRVMAEADTKELCAKYVDQMVDVIESELK